MDLLLALGTALDVLGERRQALLGRALEQREVREPLVLVCAVVDALLQAGAEPAPELLVAPTVVLEQPPQRLEHLLHQTLVDLAHTWVVLQELTADVQRQVVRLHHTAHEAQPAGQELLAVAHDQHAAHVQTDLRLARGGVEEVERCLLGQVQQRRVLERALGLEVDLVQRRVPVVAEVPVELLVLLVRDLGSGPRPQRLHRVECLCGALRLGLALDRVAIVIELGARTLDLHLDRVLDEVGVAMHDLAQAQLLQEGVEVLALPQGQRDDRAAAQPVRVLERVRTLAVRRPHRARVLSGAARVDAHLGGDHERGVEPDAELTDQLGSLLRAALLQRLEEAPRARARDRAQVVDQLLAAHADPVVRYGQRARLRVGVQYDAERLPLGQELGGRQRLEAQLVQRVAGVRDQLP